MPLATSKASTQKIEWEFLPKTLEIGSGANVEAKAKNTLLNRAVRQRKRKPEERLATGIASLAQKVWLSSVSSFIRQLWFKPEPHSVNIMQPTQPNHYAE